MSIFNSILPDIGLGETYLTIAPGDRNPDVTFARDEQDARRRVGQAAQANLNP